MSILISLGNWRWSCPILWQNEKEVQRQHRMQSSMKNEKSTGCMRKTRKLLWVWQGEKDRSLWHEIQNCWEIGISIKWRKGRKDSTIWWYEGCCQRRQRTSEDQTSATCSTFLSTTVLLKAGPKMIWYYMSASFSIESICALTGKGRCS